MYDDRDQNDDENAAYVDPEEDEDMLPQGQLA